ncbi:MAG: bifunctional aspartate kinase/homoserine dehydrogenase I [Chitinophagaceae bacterium]|nr:bifunctional aspartate kinase/homoserine dehydrogenase I [Chitinophagaceae bacterium]
MIVIKFGGTSVGSLENFRKSGAIIESYVKKKKKFCVVVSAMHQVTNKLITVANKASIQDASYLEDVKSLKEGHLKIIQNLTKGKWLEEGITTIEKHFQELESLLNGVFLVKELSPRSSDLIQSFGERLSSNIMTLYMRYKKISCIYLDTRSVIKTDGTFGNAKVNFRKTELLTKKIFSQYSDKIVICSGYIASTENDETTTLGRGGSDYTASIIAYSLRAKSIEIWTDVDGVMTADPRKVKDAYTLPRLTYIEAMEMSHFGAKVIYPPTIQPAFSKNIPIWIKNTFNPDAKGTLIDKKGDSRKLPVKGIPCIEDITILNVVGSGMIGVPGIASRLFRSLADRNINVILITQSSSEHSITFAVTPKDAKLSQEIIHKEFAQEISHKTIEDVYREENLSILAIIGENMKNTPGVTGRLFQTLGRNGINVIAIAQGSSEYNISLVINKHHLTKAINSLHEAFFLSHIKTINIFLVGIGLIGTSLLQQIQEQYEHLIVRNKLKIRVIGITNSKKMIFDIDGIELKNWKDTIENNSEEYGMDTYITRMKEYNLTNPVFVDCTSSLELVHHYEDILSSNISIITPNKLANSSDYTLYENLHKISLKKGVKFLYETNVGAGLPIIRTLQDLIYSGDEIIKIEGILSGTLSYIFNNFKKGTAFSDIVREAQEKGLTEPDPREDLKGMDVVRKILILSREVGYKLEIQDVILKPILPEECFNTPNIEAFYQELKKHDRIMENKLLLARDKRKKLRFIAKLEKKKITVSLQNVNIKHPFYNLFGSDNIVSFTTKRYSQRPLVVKGPGAGAEVTSAGVFAEIISLSSSFIQDNYTYEDEK